MLLRNGETTKQNWPPLEDWIVNMDFPATCLMTAVYKERGHYREFIESCERLQASPAVLRGCTHPWGLGQKIRLAAAFLKLPKSQPYDCFVFCDAFDVILQKPLEEIGRHYLENHSDRIIFAAERYCYPDDWKRAIYPSAPNEYRFLNSGFWIATSELARAMFELIDPERIPVSINDQQVFTDLFLAKVLPIQLDYQIEYCQCLNGALDDVTYDTEAGLVHNKTTGSTPGFIHGNGNASLKPTIECVLRRDLHIVQTVT